MRSESFIVRILLFLITITFFTACTSLIQKGGDFLEGRADKVVSVYQRGNVEIREQESRNGLLYMEISISDWPGLTLRGSLPDSNGRIYITEARFLSTHIHGWNEFNLDVLGSAIFLVTSTGNTVFYIEEDLERVQISSGRILLKGNMLHGLPALVPLRNRRERILALNEWMEVSVFNRTFTDQKEFENHWKRILFPELVRQRNRPREYSSENAQWARADSIRWNLTYTERIFPQHLWEYRNSGAMLRDWEEALPWIFVEYSWDNIISSFR